MKQVTELLDVLTEQMESRFRTGITGNMPRLPMMILYTGKHARKAKMGIAAVMQQVWRKRSEAVCHLSMEDDVFYSFSPENDAICSCSIEDVQGYVDELYNKEDCFRQMNNFFMGVVFDSRDFSDIDNFIKVYNHVDKIQEITGNTGCMTMGIVILDESASGNGISEKMRAYLNKQLRGEEKIPYRSTFIVSNRLSNGSLIRGSRLQENYNLIGRFMVLANCSDKNYSVPISMLFPPESTRYFLTASYSKIDRPNRKICEVVLSKVLNWVEAAQQNGNSLTINDICEKMQISGGGIAFFDEFFRKQILPKLPVPETLEYLPRLSNTMDKIYMMPFKEVERLTGDSVLLFYENYYVQSMRKNIEELQFEEQFRKYVMDQIKPGEAMLSLSEAMIESLISQIILKTADKMQPAHKYMETRTLTDFYRIALPICEKVLREYRELAKKQMQKLSDLIQDFENGYFVDEDEKGIQRYYDNVAMQYLEGHAGKNILVKFSNAVESEEKMLEVIFDIVRGIFESDIIFSMPLVDEMTKRMGQNAVDIQQTLQDELMRNLTQKVRLKTVMSLSRLCETYIVDQKDENGSDTAFFRNLRNAKTGQDNVMFLDSGDSNSIEVIQLYRCDAASMI